MTEYIEFSMHEAAFCNERFRRDAMVAVIGAGRAPLPGRWQFSRASVPGTIRIRWVRK